MRPPKSLFIIGGGQTGIELAQLMATFGTKVYIAEIASRILPKLDQDVGQLMEKTLADQKGITSLTQSRVVAVQKDGIGRRVTYSRGGVEKHVRVDEILVATGRMPAVDLGLENATVEFTPKGIAVNEFLQTNVKHIYAAGDVLGNESTTHTALLESRTVAHNLFTRTPISPDYHATPRVVFTNPGIAQVGLTEDDCTRRDLRISVATAPLSMVARSNTSDFRDGFVKLIADKKGTLLGATVVAPHASEIIHELTLAIRHHMTAAQVADTPHAFLSWSEAVRAAANKIA
jgi:pyruvate/2-oxoglutarate dehydrogenase complex dihydrolipoamide dehydrogenase (E3) component